MSNNVVNLWVKREERKRDLDARKHVWTCECGGQEFHLFLIGDTRCVDCQAVIKFPKR